MSDVEDVCDRVVIYYGGKIQAMGTLNELLAKPDAIRITSPVLKRESLERVLEIIRQDIGEDKVRIDNPTQNLESYFLEVVQKARQEAAQTSGAMAGTRVAAYLRGNAEAKPSTDKVLERLTASQTVTPVPEPSKAASPAVDEKKLSQLVQPSSQQPSIGTPVPEKKPVDLATADEKLSSLLGGPSGKKD